MTITDAELVDRALAEDVGAGDATAEAVVPADARGVATITQKAPGVISGLDVAEAVFLRLDPDAVVERLGPEGEWRDAGAPVLRADGAARALLTAERTALNFLGRLSGIATATARVVRAVEEAGGTARILDTRKTTPGLRRLEKQAVADGGGVNHRAGLYDAILIKENHAAAAGGVGEAVRRARAARPDLPLAVEVRDAAEIDEALAAGAPRLLLDNMTLLQLDNIPAMQAEVRALAAERGAVILAHNYQLPEIQDVADYVGDSLGLSQQAAATDADVIAFCGVHFMAETASILSPEKTVLLPDPDAGCSLADSITAEQLRAWKARHPGAVTVMYVNTTAAVKAETDYCVTSSNAVAVVEHIYREHGPDTEILFGPDMFLGAFVEH